MSIQVGQKVEIKNTLPQPWFKKAYPEFLTGKVEKVFKNGNVAIAVDQLHNRSEDGKRTIHFRSELIVKPESEFSFEGEWEADDSDWKAADAAMIKNSGKPVNLCFKCS
jgi:hypothetical protein